MSKDEGPIRVVLADDHTVMRAGVAALLAGSPGIAIVGEAGNGREAVDLVASLVPDVALVDLRMPVLDGVEATTEIVA
ncbi:response regulator transcription factor, partial [Streptomyces sp. NPDC057302]|uniref:response regulator transcription factor n=1 Tax=Streptomyces sp. NPDC057302 TaxID=3346094 RepID=UPI00363C8B80